MDLSEFLDADERPYLLCSVSWIMSAMDDTQIEKFKAALAHQSIPSKRIADVGNNWVPSRQISTAAVTRHRRGECKCND